MFLHDFAEVPSSFDGISTALAELPELLSNLIGPAFDLSVSERASPWPVSYGVPRRRDDGWVYPVWWPEGRGGLIPAIEADLGFFPRDNHTCHVELMGTYTGTIAGELSAAHGRRAHYQTVMGVRRLLEGLATRLSRPPIPGGPAQLIAHPAGQPWAAGEAAAVGVPVASGEAPADGEAPRVSDPAADHEAVGISTRPPGDPPPPDSLPPESMPPESMPPESVPHF
jgi:hypothetical protein